MALNGIRTTTQLPFANLPVFESAQVGVFGVAGRTPSPSGVSSSQNADRVWSHLNRSLLTLREQAARS